MKIGITERGDPSIDYSWVDKMCKVDGAIIITKNLTNRLIETARPYFSKLIFHISCTGYGGTIIEPNIPDYKSQIQQAKLLVANGFDINKIVIRVDPIIPTNRGLHLAKDVIIYAYNNGFHRFRISVLDCYKHVRDRFYNLNISPPYDTFSAPSNMFINLDKMIKELKTIMPNIVFESCAENKLTETERIGCISEKDICLLGLDYNNIDSIGYQRAGCMCCSNKTELLSNKKTMSI